MDINRNNYEAWLLDLMEGRLSSSEVQEVRDFISLNPDCAVGQEDFEPWILEAKDLSFSGKKTLRKELPDSGSLVSEKDFDLFSIASLEGDLSELQQKDYQQILDGDEEKMKEWLQWKQMKLTGTSILFPGKDSLKKRVLPTSRVIWISVAAAAAALALFFTIFSSDQGINYEAPMALETESKTESPAEQITPESDEENLIAEIPLEETPLEKTPLEEASKPSTPLAGETSLFSIRKRKDPPELTGEKRDTSSRKINETELLERPIRVAMLEHNRPPVQGTYDKIEKLDFVTQTGNTEHWTEDAYSDEGLKESYKAFLEEKDISLLNVASAGVEGINRLYGSDLKLNVARDEKGEVRRFRFKSGLISVDSPVKKRKNPE